MKKFELSSLNLDTICLYEVVFPGTLKRIHDFLLTSCHFQLNALTIEVIDLHKVCFFYPKTYKQFQVLQLSFSIPFTMYWPNMSVRSLGFFWHSETHLDLSLI